MRKRCWAPFLSCVLVTVGAVPTTGLVGIDALVAAVALLLLAAAVTGAAFALLRDDGDAAGR